MLDPSGAPVRVGIIGLGRSGWNMHAAALADHPGFAVTAAADAEPQRLAEAAAGFGCSVCTEPAGVLGAADVDVVVVATPSHTHHALTLQAIEAGKHVVVEKPMAQSTSELDEMITAAEQAGRVLTCFQQRRLEPTLTATQHILASGRIGRVVLIRSVRSRFMRRADWQTLRKFGGGELANHGAHLIDQVLPLLGDGPVEVFADLQHTVGAGDAEDHVKVCLRGGNGVVADIEYSLCAAFPRQAWEVIGTAGSIYASDETMRVRWLKLDSLESLAVHEGPAAERRYHNHEELEWNDEVIDVRSDDVTLTRLFYNKLHATLTAGEPLFVTPQSVRRQIEIIEACRAQARGDFELERAAG